MMSASVIIRKQHIMVHAPDEQEALKLRKVINDSLQYDLVNMMEKVFGKYAGQNGYVNIDKIDLDLGTIHAPGFEQQFVGLVETKLVQELSKKLSGSEGLFSWQDHTGSGRTNEMTGIPDSSFQFSSQIQQDITAFLHFLEHGIFPWWYKESHFKSPNELLQNFTDPEWETLLRLVVTLKHTRSSVSLERIVQRIFQYLPETSYVMAIDQLIRVRVGNNSGSSVQKLLGKRDELQQLLDINEKEFHKLIFRFLLRGDEVGEFSLISRVVEEFQRGRGAGYEHLDRSKDVRIENEGIYIENAGLVLLNPFLPQLFTATGLINDAGLFPDEAARSRAALLLYYIQAGNDDCKEWEIAFNKILCGMACDDVLPDGLTLSAKDKEAADEMLQVVVNYWEALKGASVDSVRNTFLLRTGKITWRESYWLLQVERSGVDILLDKLPWGFGTVKFSWLSHLIHTEW